VSGTAPPRRLIVAACQIEPRFRDNAGNLKKMETWVRQAAERGAGLIAFPECALSGYCYTSLADAMTDAEPVPGPACERLARVAAETGAYVVFGLIERAGDRIFNTAALLGPEGFVGSYRKTHLPHHVVDKLVTLGDVPFPVFETAVGRIGILICYDLRLPEPARIMALAGADILVHPTNLPPAGHPQPDHMYRTRAAENAVWILSADRVGTERGVRFIGRSAVVSPAGETIAEANDRSEELLVAEIAPALAREKDRVMTPGMYELHLFADRRPELYAALLDHH
jgi:5-aminopentanamidase